MAIKNNNEKLDFCEDNNLDLYPDNYYALQAARYFKICNYLIFTIFTVIWLIVSKVLRLIPSEIGDNGLLGYFLWVGVHFCSIFILLGFDKCINLFREKTEMCISNLLQILLTHSQVEKIKINFIGSDAEEKVRKIMVFYNPTCSAVIRLGNDSTDILLADKIRGLKLTPDMWYQIVIYIPDNVQIDFTRLQMLRGVFIT